MYFYPRKIIEINDITEAEDDVSFSIEERTMEKDTSIKKTSDLRHTEKIRNDVKGDEKEFFDGLDGSNSNTRTGTRTTNCPTNR